MGTLGRNIATTYLARFASVLGVFALFPFVAGQVGPSAFGVYLLTTSVATLFSQDLGMAGATTRFVAEAKARGDDVALRRVVASSSIFFVVVGLGSAALTAAVFAIGWSRFTIPDALRHSAVVIVVIISAQLLFLSAVSVNKFVLSGSGRLDLSNWIQIMQLVVRIATTIAVLAAGAGIVGVALADTSAVLISGMVMWWARRRTLPQSISRPSDADFAAFRHMFRLSADLLIISVAAIVILQAGSIIVSLLLPIAAVAVFGAGFRIYRVCRELTNSLTAALLPAATDQYVRDNHEAIKRLYIVGTRQANVLIGVAVIPVIIFARPIVEWWVGPSFADGALVAQVLALSMFANNNHLVALPILTGQGDVRTFASLHVLWAALSISLGFVLTPAWGVAGMALAVAVPVVMLEPLYLRCIVRRLGLRWREFWVDIALRSYGCALPLAVVLWLASRGVPGGGAREIVALSAIWAVSYLGAYWMWAASAEDRDIARRISTVCRSSLRSRTWHRTGESL